MLVKGATGDASKPGDLYPELPDRSEIVTDVPVKFKSGAII